MWPVLWEWLRPSLVIEAVALSLIVFVLRRERVKLGDHIEDLREALVRQIRDVEEDLADVAAPAVPLAPDAPGPAAEALRNAENWERVRKTWREARDWIELLIEEIPDGRQRAKYNRLSRRDFEPIITMLRKDKRIGADAAADLIALNELFQRLRPVRAATKAEADDFVGWYRRATKEHPAVAPTIAAAKWASDAEVRRFWNEPNWNDLTGNAEDDPAQRAELAERFKMFMKRPDAQELIDCFALYAARCLAFPFRTAYSRWVISLPAGRRSNIANLSVGLQWAAVCYVSNEGGPLFEFYGNGSILKRAFGRNLERLVPNACDASEATEVVAGGADQWKLVCYPREVTQLLGRHEVVRALRQVSMELMKRDPLHRRHHCFDLADALLAKARAIA
jgi:hypothetical protein